MTLGCSTLAAGLVGLYLWRTSLPEPHPAPPRSATRPDPRRAFYTELAAQFAAAERDATQGTRPD